MENSTELESIIRSLLVINPIVIKASQLQRDYEKEEGQDFPFRKLGFSSFLDYLKSIPHIVRLDPYNGYNPNVLPIVTKEISHIDQLVSKQRTSAPSRKKSFNKRGRGYGYARREAPPPRRRPSGNYVPPMFTPCNKVENGKEKEYKSSQNYGNDNSRCPAEGRQSYRDDKGCKLKLSSSAEINSPGGKQTKQSFGIPAGEEFENNEDEDDYYEDIDSSKYHDLDNMEYNDEFFENIDEETVSSYTIQRFTDNLHKSELKSEYSKGRYEEEYKEDLFVEESTSGDYGDSFSKPMIRNFQSILAKYPDGISSTDLPQKYLEETGYELNINELGYSSVIQMVSFLPSVFTYEKASPCNWKLYDARLHHNGKVTAEAGNLDGSYVPESIFENVLKLVGQYPEGIKSTQLLTLYERVNHKKLDLEALGFNCLEDFLEILKKRVTVTKSTGYYLLFPKHKTIALDVLKSHNEELKLQVNCFEFMGPENVLKPSDIIPLQKLPDLKVFPKSPEEPLMELEVRLAEVMTPSMFFFILDSNFNELQNMMEDLEKFYQQEETNFHIILPYLTTNLYCVCKYENSWHRAKITGLKPNNMVDIEYIDYGTPERVKGSSLRFLHTDFAKLPAQGICAKLLGINPVGGGKKWPAEACREFLNIVTEKRLLAYVYNVGTRKNKDQPKLDLILYDTEGPKEMICNEYLVEKGFAQFSNKTESEDVLEEDPQFTNQNSFSATPPPSSQNEDVLEGRPLIMNEKFTTANQPTSSPVPVNRFINLPPKLKNYIFRKYFSLQKCHEVKKKVGCTRPILKNDSLEKYVKKSAHFTQTVSESGNCDNSLSRHVPEDEPLPSVQDEPQPSVQDEPQPSVQKVYLDRASIEKAILQARLTNLLL